MDDRDHIDVGHSDLAVEPDDRKAAHRPFAGFFDAAGSVDVRRVRAPVLTKAPIRSET